MTKSREDSGFPQISWSPLGSVQWITTSDACVKIGSKSKWRSDDETSRLVNVSVQQFSCLLSSAGMHIADLVLLLRVGTARARARATWYQFSGQLKLSGAIVGGSVQWLIVSVFPSLSSIIGGYLGCVWGCLEGVWRVSGGVWRVSGDSMEGVWRMSLYYPTKPTIKGTPSQKIRDYLGIFLSFVSLSV